MPYIQETCVAGDTIEISKYYSYRYRTKGEKRHKKVNQTSESQKKVNQRKAEKELRRLMAANFKNGDALIRLDFHHRPGGSEEMQPLMEKFTRRMRAAFKKQGKQYKYIYVKEIGPRGGRHIHLLMAREGLDLLELVSKAWPYGIIHIDLWSTGPDFSKLAAYFIKYAAKTEETEGKLIGKRWYPSRNLKKPKITKKVVKSNRFRETVSGKKGFYIKTDSIRTGISDITGYRYLSYTLIRQEGIESG